MTAAGPAVLTVADLDGHADGLGGKGTRLAELERLDYAVPPWFAVSGHVYASLLAQPAIREELDGLLAALAAGRPFDEARGRVAALLLGADPGSATWKEIEEAYGGMFAGDAPVAVRSSASVEDGPARSFAGQLESSLEVSGVKDLRRAIRRSWASAFSPHALAYGRLHGIRPDELEVAVVVQKMVPARTAGVMFTADPVSGRDDVVAISAVPGLAVPLVSGVVAGDSYLVKKETLAVDRAEGSALMPNEVRELARLGLRLEADFAGPQDVEWALDDARVFVLQARPLTGAAPPDQPIVWDNANIVESYPGITLPLTYSVAREAYTAVYRNAGALAGLSRSVLDANDDAYRSMIGLVRGRVYYNLTSWYRLLSLLPGFRHNKVFMEEMMGVGATLEWPAKRGRVREAIGVAGLVVRAVYLALTLERRVAAFERLIEETCREHDRADVRELDLSQLVRRYDRLKDRLFGSWQAPIVNDFLTMVFHGVLRRLIEKHELESDGNLGNDLLRGDGRIRSVEPARAVMRLAEIVRADAEVSALFARSSDRELTHLCSDEALSPEFKAELDQYLAAYGSSCTQELKLEVPSVRDDPASLFAAVRAYLDRERSAWQPEGGSRERAERGVRRGLGTRTPRALVFRWVLGRTRRHLVHRENMRIARGRAFGVARDLVTAIGTRLHEAGRLDNARDVFYLTIDEVRASVRPPEQHLRSLAASRRREFDAYRSEAPPPDRFETVGDALLPVDGVVQQAPGPVLRGHACCSGVVRGRPRLLEFPHAEQLERGEILVARQTDPGWVTVFPLAAGILVERGSALSHSAIVARELGIPTIVGIPGLTEAVRGATEVEMDGASGTVRLVGAAG
ncbi:MAG: PEP-utilizing enzyme [Actinomycetota bacterium]|nr:PEP-utilizing enzyme [Actinomycetota bacterium]